MVKTRPFDPATYIYTSEGVEASLAEALSHDDAAIFADALQIVARAPRLEGMASRVGMLRAALAAVLDGSAGAGSVPLVRIFDGLGPAFTVKSAA